MFTNQTISARLLCKKIMWWILFNLSYLYVCVYNSKNYVCPVHTCLLVISARMSSHKFKMFESELMVLLTPPSISLQKHGPSSSVLYLSRLYHHATSIEPETLKLFFTFSLLQTPHPIYIQAKSFYLWNISPKFSLFHLHCFHPNPNLPHLLPGIP